MILVCINQICLSTSVDLKNSKEVARTTFRIYLWNFSILFETWMHQSHSLQRKE